ncbi:MAG: hypothetical protein CXR30_17235 [Geobacter sp.]|nr:MAG: hypothetical protein CXR30_17235 [Geobacter sp.]
MTRVLNITKVQETHLWSLLAARENEESRVLSVNVITLCDEAVNRMKAMYAYAPQYTLHDDRHLLRTTELMGLVLGDVAKKLNDVELSLLILAAFFHDQGMVMSADEYRRLEGDEKFQLFRDNWRVEHPNYKETTTQLCSSNCSKERKVTVASQIAELDAAMFTDYIRETHGNRVTEFIRSVYANDKRLEIQAINLAPFLAKMCKSHTLPTEALTSQAGFHCDEQIGTYTVNLPFLAMVLRLADILDFDRDRTPEALLKSIHFSSTVSLFEWEKHRSVEGWQISSDLIRFTIRCKHPAYEAAARQYMDWVDAELAASREICRMQPRDIKGYELSLPTHVDRSRIQPLDDAYQFHNLEFSLSRDEVVHLLMTDKLYGRENLCIRELLQNSLDAIRYRKALFSEAKIPWNDGGVAFRHYVNDDGYEVLECSDNGSGMDEDIIKNFFVRAGRSFYRSPYFERERNRLKASGNDFDPCSKFGIGFMSCFMLGDRITITTRRDYGYGREVGPPIIAEIQGLSGLVVVKKGDSMQPIGTTISIVTRQKPSFLDAWTDKVWLCRTLKGYALATEFPISAQCDVPELKETLTIPPIIEPALTPMEKGHVQQCVSLFQDLSKVTPNLSGFAKESFLVDENGIPCVSNDEAGWSAGLQMSRKTWRVVFHSSELTVGKHFNGEGIPVCMDGILVAGKPGRPSFRSDTQILGWRNSKIYSPCPALIDVRGKLKPEITPGRIPPENMGIDLPPGWKQLSETFQQGLGLLWEQYLNYVRKGMAPDTFWKLSVIHVIKVSWIPSNTLWELLSISLFREGHNTEWSMVRELGELSFCEDSEMPLLLQDKRGLVIGPDTDLDNWEKDGEESPHLSWAMNSIVLLMCCLDIREGCIFLSPLAPSNAMPLAQYANSQVVGINMFFIQYVGNASDALAVQTPFPTANRNHPLAQISFQSRHAHAPSDLQSFAMSFVACISEAISPRDVNVSLDKPGYWQKRVGHLYFSVQWSQVDESLRPPYRLWSKEKGWFSFNEEEFTFWKNSDANAD